MLIKFIFCIFHILSTGPLKLHHGSHQELNIQRRSKQFLPTMGVVYYCALVELFFLMQNFLSLIILRQKYLSIIKLIEVVVVVGAIRGRTMPGWGVGGTKTTHNY